MANAQHGGIPVKWIRERVLNREFLCGTFLNLGSSLTAEIAGNAGFDWVMIDLEHGVGDRSELLLELQALESTPAVPLVRVPWNDPVAVKRVLDLGASGIMVPYVQTADEARSAVAAMRYPPQGIRGVAMMNRACGFGPGFEEYFRKANSSLLTILQIETPTAVDNSEAIAAVDGADALFIGPADLSVSMGVPGQWDHPKMRAAREKVLNACQKNRKAAATIVSGEDQIGPRLAEGFTFLAHGSDSATVLKGMQSTAAAFRRQYAAQKS
jgi:2-keto-3-deoxy-L-rhamnonate aldolase RhmA